MQESKDSDASAPLGIESDVGGHLERTHSSAELYSLAPNGQ